MITEVKNDKDLKDAIVALDMVWAVRPNEIGWDERCKLVKLISAYEDEHVHIQPPTPEEAAAFRAEQEGR